MRFHSSGLEAWSSLGLGFFFYKGGWRESDGTFPPYLKEWFSQSLGQKRCPLSFHLPAIEASSSHLALTLSPSIHYLIHLLSPCILLSQISSLTSQFLSPERTCKQSISSCKNTRAHKQRPNPTIPQTHLHVSIISAGNRLLGCVEEGRDGNTWRGRKNNWGVKSMYSQEEHSTAAASVWNYSAYGASRLRGAVHLLK